MTFFISQKQFPFALETSTIILKVRVVMSTIGELLQITYRLIFIFIERAFSKLQFHILSNGLTLKFMKEVVNK